MDLWMIRLEALRLANAGANFLDTGDLIFRADAIEQYIKHGATHPEMRDILSADASADAIADAINAAAQPEN